MNDGTREVPLAEAILDRAEAVAVDADATLLGRAAEHVLDTTACVVAGADHPTARRLRAAGGLRWEREGREEGEADRPAGGAKARGLRETVSCEATLREAMLAGVTRAHVDEFDAIHTASATLPAAVVIPPAVLVATALRRGGDELLRAVIAGYEAVAEVGTRFGGPALYADRWWPGALFGPVGTAVALARLYRLSRERTLAAIGLAAGGMAGLLPPDRLGDAHYVALGRSACAGLDAVRFAAAGMEVDPRLLEGAVAATLRRRPAEAGSRTPHLLGCSLKAYPCARPLHAAVSALEDLLAEGLRPETVTGVRIGLPPAALRFVTVDPRPADPAAAAASAPFVVAATLSGDIRNIAIFRSAGAVSGTGETAPVISDTVDDSGAGLHVAIEAGEVVGAAYPRHWGAEVTVTTSTGGSYRRVVLDPPGDPALPMTRDQLTAKAERLLRGREGAARHIADCLALERATDVARLRLLPAGL
ncbi:MmgE/PrpD family protein [Streptosporangium sp. NPDC049046]|uniref:MmgE/PrpD family protein n=1 Tax=Streptosporangium sp. NPDC049046 TaxID=3155031 RepID=UPI003448C869